ncbi:hypothetical protein D3C81_1716660 [compost metagenome]
MNVLVRIFGSQEQHLCDDRIGYHVINLRSKENDAVLQQAGIDVISALAAVALFYYHRNITHVENLLELVLRMCSFFTVTVLTT